jgi:hypothetical protein
VLLRTVLLRTVLLRTVPLRTVLRTVLLRTVRPRAVVPLVGVRRRPGGHPFILPHASDRIGGSASALAR